jgi:hypothetical protein
MATLCRATRPAPALPPATRLPRQFDGVLTPGKLKIRAALLHAHLTPGFTVNSEIQFPATEFQGNDNHRTRGFQAEGQL